MLTLALLLFLSAALISFLGTYLAKRLAHRLHLIDAPGHRKVHTVPTPRNGGLGIFAGLALPILAALAVLYLPQLVSAFSIQNSALAIYLPGLRAHAPLALLLLLTTFLTHLLGLLDDRKPLAPWPKLLAQLAIASLLVFGGELLQRGGFRLPMLFGPYLGLGFYLSAFLSILWIVALTNAFNFLDNMDGLSAGVAFICAAMFLVAAYSSGQLFICALLLLFLGSLAGFLPYNFPPASIFMGDGGSLVIGFFLSALTIRTTYYNPDHWWAILMPLLILAVPLYDLIIVSILRLAKGRSPMSGDTNHFSHRLTRHGFSKRGAVLVIYAVTLASGLSAPLLAHTDSTGAILISLQALAILTVIAILERVGEHTT